MTSSHATTARRCKGGTHVGRSAAGEWSLRAPPLDPARARKALRRVRSSSGRPTSTARNAAYSSGLSSLANDSAMTTAAVAGRAHERGRQSAEHAKWRRPPGSPRGGECEAGQQPQQPTYTVRVEDTRAAPAPDPEADDGPVLDVGADDDDPAERSRRRRRNRTVLVVALVLLLVPVLVVGGYLAWLNQIVTNNVKNELLLPDGSEAGALPTDAGGNPVPLPAGKGTNYLIIGGDAGPGRSGSRSDVMVLAHVPADHRNVTLIHFPRDLYVSIPGKGKNKLNAAYAFGGAPLLVTTMQNLLGVKIDHVAITGFENFKAMTDAVGGVDVDVEEASNSDGNQFDEGVMHMDGTQALAFVRERKQLSEGDISRGRRELAVIKAIMLKGLEPRRHHQPAPAQGLPAGGHRQPHGRPDARRRHHAVGGHRHAGTPRQRRPLHHRPVQRLRHEP